MTSDPTILLLDHDPMLREVTASMLTRRGGQVHAAASLDEALLYARGHLYDVAVIDAADTDSPSEVLDAMADTGCLPRRLVICAPGPLRDREAEKFSAVLQKPFDFEQLVAAIFGPSGHRRRPARSGLFPRMRACVRTPRRAARGRRGHG